MSFLFKKVAAQDAAEFKVGDKVKRKAAINGSVYKIIAVGRGFHGETINKLSGHTYPYEWYKEHEIVAAVDGKGEDSSRWTDLDDGIKTIENKARALIADAKNTRSKYAEILARSEIAKNNAPVKKTFEDDIARCDKLINALKAI